MPVLLPPRTPIGTGPTPGERLAGHLGDLDIGTATLARIDSFNDTSLSPEALIQVAARRLRSLDDSISGAMAEMNDRGTHLAYLRAVTVEINRYRASHAPGETLNMDSIIEVRLPNGEPTNVTLSEALRMGGMERPMTGHLDNDQAASELEAISAQVSSVNEGADIAQLQLQQFVTSRGQVTQTVSQLLAALHDNVKGILQNTRA